MADEGAVEHSGDRTAALQFLLASIENSSPGDHDFVTKAQCYWSLLIEDGKTDQAKTFVLGLYRWAASKDLPEVKELVEETFGGLQHGGH